MENFEEAKVKLVNNQLNKLKYAATLRIAKENFQDEELLHELFLATRQKTKMRNTFANNMSMDVKLCKAQLSKIVQSGGFCGALLGKFGGPWMKGAVNLAKMYKHH